MEHLDIDLQQTDAALIVTLRGDAGMTTVDKLENAVKDIAAKKPRLVVISLAEVTFMGSLALGSLLWLRQELRHNGGNLHLAAPSKVAASVIAAAKFGTTLSVYPTVEAALVP